MKTFLLPTLLVFFVIFQSNTTSAQLNFSLDSTHYYDADNILEEKEIVTEKDSEGYQLKTSSYQFEPSGAVFNNEKREYVYFADKDTKFYRSFDCFPNNDTCILTYEVGNNEIGERTSYLYRSIDVIDVPDQLEFTYDVSNIDSFVLDSDGRVLSAYSFRIDAIENEKILNSRTDYFFTSGNKRDSAHRYDFDGTDFVLDRRTHFKYNPSGNTTNLDYIYNTYTQLNELIWDEINGTEKLTSLKRFTVNGLDTLLSFEETITYDDFFSVLTYNFYSSDGSGNISFGGKDEIYLLGDMETRDSLIFFDLNTDTGDYEFDGSYKYFYTNLSFTTNYAPSNEVILYPNPSQDFLRLKTSKNDFQSEQQYHIIDVLGEVKNSGDYFGNLIDISNLPNGNYYLLLETGITKPFVIQR